MLNGFVLLVQGKPIEAFIKMREGIINIVNGIDLRSAGADIVRRSVDGIVS